MAQPWHGASSHPGLPCVSWLPTPIPMSNQQYEIPKPPSRVQLPCPSSCGPFLRGELASMFVDGCLSRGHLISFFLGGRMVYVKGQRKTLPFWGTPIQRAKPQMPFPQFHRALLWEKPSCPFSSQSSSFKRQCLGRSAGRQSQLGRGSSGQPCDGLTWEVNKRREVPKNVLSLRSKWTRLVRT